MIVAKTEGRTIKLRSIPGFLKEFSHTQPKIVLGGSSWANVSNRTLYIESKVTMGPDQQTEHFLGYLL